MDTASAHSARRFARIQDETALTRAEILRAGFTSSALQANLDAGRWRRVGSAVITHTGPLTRRERLRAALLNSGPRTVLTAFTAAEQFGLRNWERDEIHLLGPLGVQVRQNTGLAIKLHRTRASIGAQSIGVRRLHRLEPALVVAASTFARPRPACGLFAAAVGQRLTTASRLLVALEAAPRARHRRVLLTATADIAMGAHALSEIDFFRLCRRNGLPLPSLQSVRTDRWGRRRYLDATWHLPSGRVVVCEVDGALHLVANYWWEDQLRQNELTLVGSSVLRFPSVIIRTSEPLVVDQLRRALLLA